MRRSELEHLIRAAGSIVGCEEVLVLGSQAVLGQFPDAPMSLLTSMEADVVPLGCPECSVVIDGAIGEGSIFQKTFGYYAHGVGEETAILPEGWRERLVEILNANTRAIRGLCLEVHDLAVSKLAAGRAKDLEFVRTLLHHRLADPETIIQRARTLADRDLAGRVVARAEQLRAARRSDESGSHG